MTKRIAAITMARNDEFFLNRWIAYYGKQIGEENLYIYLDGMDQKPPSNAGRANIKRMEHRELSRARGDRHRIKLLSDLARNLFDRGYDLVIGCDTDEFLIVDPNAGQNLREYLSDLQIETSVSGLGLDIGQDLNREDELDQSKPFLIQRSYALLSTRYTKPVVISKPVRWGSGFHKIRGHNFHIDPNLYLLHFGSVDYEMIRTKVGDRNPDWRNHIKRRARTIFMITRAKRRNASLRAARVMQRIFRPFYALNKPGMLGIKKITALPARFRKSGV